MVKEENGHRGMRLRTKVLLFAVLCAAVAAAIFGAFLLGASRSGEREPVITSALLGEQLRSVQQLVTVEYHYTNMGKFEDQKDFYGWKVPFTTKSFIVSYDGIIKAGIDMADLDIEVDENTKSITITVPGSGIIAHEILEDSLEVFDESSNIFNPISIEDYNGFTADQKAEMEEKAIERGLFISADEKTLETIESLLALLPGLDEYTVSLEMSKTT